MKLMPRSLMLLLTMFVDKFRSETDGNPCPMNETEPAPDGAHVVDGNLLAGEPERSYPPSQYRLVDGEYLLCTCAIKSCVRKCCESGMAYDSDKECSASPGEIVGKFENFTVPKYVKGSEVIGTHETDEFHLVYGVPVCPEDRDEYRLRPSSANNDHNFNVSGTGWLLDETTGYNVGPGSYCLERFSASDLRVTLIVCSPLPTNNHVYDVFYKIGIMLSLPFSLATFLVYALIKELRNLYGKSLMCHVASHMVAYISLLIVNLIANDIGTDVCVIFAYITQFTFLASFFWLNVMCIDLCWTFSGIRYLRENSRDRETKKFLIYSIYSWGCTFLISVFTFYMEVFPISSIEIRPEFGKTIFGVKRCWFASDKAKVLYFYGPIGIILIANLVMFLYTSLIIVKHKREAKVLRISGSKKNVNHEKQKYLLFLNLSIVMGAMVLVNWLLKRLSVAFKSNISDYVWYITYIGFSSQGLFIFLIFVCKKRVLKLIKGKFFPEQGSPTYGHRAGSGTSSFLNRPYTLSDDC